MLALLTGPAFGNIVPTSATSSTDIVPRKQSALLHQWLSKTPWVSYEFGEARQEVETSNLRHLTELTPGTLVSNVKASWARKLVISSLGMSNTFKAAYDYKAKPSNFNEVALDGEVAQLGGKLSYSMKRTFSTSTTDAHLKLTTPAFGGVKLATEYDLATPDNLKSVSLPMGWELADEQVGLSADTEWLVASKTMKYSAGVRAWGSRLSGAISRKVSEKGPALAYEVKAAQAMGEGRGLSAKLAGSAKPEELALEWVDSKTTPRSTWTVAATLPVAKGWKAAAAEPSITLKRSMAQIY